MHTFALATVINLLIVFGDVWGYGVTLSSFAMRSGIQLPNQACQGVNRSGGLSRVMCAAVCARVEMCQGFSFTCFDPDLLSSCQCMICSNADLNTSTDKLNSQIGILASKVETLSPREMNISHPGGPGVVFPTSDIMSTPSSTPEASWTRSTYPPVRATREPPFPRPPPFPPACPPPPLIPRTTVTHSATPTHEVAVYTCSVNSDVYIRGTNTVACTDEEDWSVATILCAPTKCWYTHAIWGPVYAGTLSVTEENKVCQEWAMNEPQVKNVIYDENTMYPSDNDSKAEARNYCRVFADDSGRPWCYWNESSGWTRKFGYCDVIQCPDVPGERSH